MTWRGAGDHGICLYARGKASNTQYVNSFVKIRLYLSFTSNVEFMVLINWHEDDYLKLTNNYIEYIQHVNVCQMQLFV